MPTDVQICSDCGWTVIDDNVNPYRKQCPKCEADLFGREEIQWFGGHGAEGREW